MKKTKIIVSGIIGLVVVIVLLYFVLGMNSGFNATEDYRYEVLDAFSVNVLDIQVIDYDLLDEKYKALISEDKYNSLQSSEEILDTYMLFNTINTSAKSATTITTDGFKTEPCGTVISNNKTYFIYHHIDFKESFSKPKVVRWYIEINETENHL